MNTSRRLFLRTSLGTSAVVMLGNLRNDWLQHVRAADDQAKDMPPEKVASGEAFWFQVQQAFDVDRSIINLNNGGVAPSPRTVQSAYFRQLEFANNLPSRNLWQVQDPQVEHVRAELARTFGCDAEEMALTRNASESLQIAINGFDYKRGDEVLTTTQDYPRMINTLKQRELRDGIVLKQFSLPIPAESQDQIFDLYVKNITPKTKAILLSHIVNITGQILPVKRICEMARKRGILTIVDGAHAFAHFTYSYRDLLCDIYATSLHKWLTAPIGTGFLFIRKGLIADVWPLTAPEKPKSPDIRKFEEIGTHPTAPRLAIGEALAFYHGIGPARKEARLRFLRDYWAKKLLKHDNVNLKTSLAPEHSCGVSTVEIKDVDSVKLADYLWTKHKVFVTAIKHAEFAGIRVTPNVYTTLRELDIFVDAMERVAKGGLPE